MTIYDAEIYEPVAAVVTADSTGYTADNTTWPTADGGLLEGARDVADAEVIAATVPVFGGGYYPTPRSSPIEGVGYGVLPRLQGEAHGVVIAASIGAAMPRNLAGEAAGAVGAGGHSQARLAIKAAASGVRGSKGNAAAILGFGAAGSGAVVARGNGLAVIGNSEIIATGRQDDDEAAIIWLLAA